MRRGVFSVSVIGSSVVGLLLAAAACERTTAAGARGEQYRSGDAKGELQRVVRHNKPVEASLSPNAVSSQTAPASFEAEEPSISPRSLEAELNRLQAEIDE
jgi:hypothetical protein